jgi:hypothetical protein
VHYLEDHGDGGDQSEDQVLQLRKEERETKFNGDQDKCIDRILFATQDTVDGVSGFKIHSRTTKRG